MWRQYFLIYLLTVRGELETRHHNVWRQVLHDCLKQIQLASVQDMFRTLSECTRTKVVVNQLHSHFPYALVGEIHNDPSTSSRRWWIEQNSKTVIQWDIIEVRIFTKDSQCSEFYIEWKWEHSMSRFCGFFFGDSLKPLKRYSRGSVTLSQQLAEHSKEESRFQLVFHVVKARTIAHPRIVATYAFTPSPTNVDYEYDLLKFLLVGSSPVVLLNITVSEIRYATSLLELRDGPSPESSDIICRTDSWDRYNDSDCFATAYLTTSFQAFFIYHIDIEKATPLPSFVLRWKSELTYVKIPDEDVPVRVSGTSFYHHKRPVSGSGLELMIIADSTFGSSVSNLRHVYKGPSMHITNQDEMCQYGGLWIYTGDWLEHLSDLVLLARDCTSSSTGMSVLVSEEMYVPPRKYFFIASVQYYGISESNVSYSAKSSLIYRISGEFSRASVFDYTDKYKTLTVDLFVDPQILANMKEQKSFYFTKDNISNKRLKVTVRVCTLYTTSYVRRGDCSCQMLVFRHFYYVTNEKWCEDGISKRIGLETFTTKPLEQAMNECLVAEIMYPINITLTCKQCQEPSFVVSKITTGYNVPDHLWARSESYLTENSYSTWLRRYDGWIQHDNDVPLDIMITFQRRKRDGRFQQGLRDLFPRPMFHRYMVEITRCVNGRKVKTTRSLQLGDSIHSYVPHCRDACHVSIEQAPGQVPIPSNLFGVFVVNLHSDDPDGDLSDESHSGKHLLIHHNTSPNQRYTSWKMAFTTCREKNAYLPSVMTIEMANDIIAAVLNYTAMTQQHQHYQRIPILCLQNARLGFKQVMLLGDKYIEEVSASVCRKCSYCSLTSPSDDQLCPFLVVKGTSRVIGYTLHNCAQRVEIPSIVCWPFGAAINGMTKAMSKPAVVNISSEQTNCPPNSHKLNSKTCLTLPQLIHDAAVATTDNCTCDATGLPIFSDGTTFHVIRYTTDLRGMGFFPTLIFHWLSKSRKARITERHWTVWEGKRTLEQTGNRIYSVHREPFRLRMSGQVTSLCSPAVELCRVKLRSVGRECPYGFVTCGDGTCIVESSRCDGQVDCVGEEDELGCSTICTRPHSTSMCSECSIGEDCRCHALYFQCSSGGCVTATAICDGVLACSDGSDEVMCPSPWQQLLLTDGCATTQVPYTCSHTIKNFNIFKRICVYSGPTDSWGEHLRFCENFQCSLGQNKCQGAYCIPMHYICDKVCDCPVCDDETPCLVDDMQLVKLSCPGMVKCKSGYPCVHALHVQDGEAQCEETHDDEVHYPRCPEHCLCHGTSITCGSYDDISSSLINEFTALSAANNDLYSLSILQSLWAVCEQRCGRLLYIDVSQVAGLDVGFLRSVGEYHGQLYLLNASHNHFGILEFSVMKNLRKLLQLYVHHCGIHEIDAGVFTGADLHILDLSYNELHMLRVTSFGQMRQLKHIFLQNNRIEVLDLRIFRESSHLLSLHLQNNRILALRLDPSHWISAARPLVVRSDEEVLCCIIPTTRSCYVGEHTFHTCHTLLLRPGNKFILLTLGFPVLLINTSALVYIIFWKSRQRQAIKRQIITSSLYAITDGLYGFHLLGLTIADILYDKDFDKYKEIWKSNAVCSLIETIFSFCLTVSSSFIIHMCTVLILSIINLAATVSDKTYKLTLVGITVSSMIFASGRRLLIMNVVSVKANRFCFPFVVDGMATLSTTQLSYEVVSFSLQMVVCAASLVGLVLVILLIKKHRRKLAGNRNARQGSHGTVKLFIYIGLVLMSKVGVLVVWLSILAGLSVQPDVVLLLVSCATSVWALCHPFIHTLKPKLLICQLDT